MLGAGTSLAHQPLVPSVSKRPATNSSYFLRSRFISRPEHPVRSTPRCWEHQSQRTDVQRRAPAQTASVSPGVFSHARSQAGVARGTQASGLRRPLSATAVLRPSSCVVAWTVPGAGRCSTGRTSTGHGRSPHAQTREERGKGNVPVSSHTPSEAHSLRSLPSTPCLSSTASCHTPGALRTRTGRCTEPPVSTLARPGVATVLRTCSHCHLLSNRKKSGLSRVNTTRPECGR